MAKKTSSKASSGKENRGSSENKRSGNNQTNKRFAKREFKFFAADSEVKKPYTHEKIEEAIILKIQTTFEGVTVPDVLTSLRKRQQHVYEEPELVVSTDTDAAKKAAKDRRNTVRYDKKYDQWEANMAEFSSLWTKAYGLIWESYMSSELKRIIKEMSDYETVILDDPLKLLETIEQQVHVPSRAVYPTLTLIKSLNRLLAVKQGDKEGLTSYMERFKSKKNVFTNLFGDGILDGYCRNHADYKRISGSEQDLRDRQKEFRKSEMDKFWAMLYLKGADQGRYGSLLTEWRQSFANNQDLYPENIHTMVDIMRVMPVKKVKKGPKVPKQEDITPSQEVGFAQTGEPLCFCCGDGHYLRDCGKKGTLPKEEWVKPSYWKQCYVDDKKKRQAKRDREKAQAGNPQGSNHLQVETCTVCGFCGVQVEGQPEGPEEIIDSGSTVKLMKSKEIVTDIRKSEKKLSLATNGGEKIVDETCNVPAFGGDPGWYSESALTNIHGLSEIVSNGHHVIFDSKKHNGFIIKLKTDEVLPFTCDERGLYTKDPKPMVNWCMTQIQGYTPREVRRGKRCRKLLHDLDAPSTEDLAVLLRLNLI